MVSKVTIYLTFFNYNNFLSKYTNFYVLNGQSNNYVPSESSLILVPRDDRQPQPNKTYIDSMMIFFKHFDLI